MSRQTQINIPELAVVAVKTGFIETDNWLDPNRGMLTAGGYAVLRYVAGLPPVTSFMTGRYLAELTYLIYDHEQRVSQLSTDTKPRKPFIDKVARQLPKPGDIPKINSNSTLDRHHRVGGGFVGNDHGQGGFIGPV